MAAESQQSEPLSELTAFQRDVLNVVSMMESPHGLAIKDQLNQAYGVDDVNSGRLYPALNALDDLGLIEKRERDKDKRTNTYVITNRGLRELDSHREWFGSAIDGGDVDE